MGLREITPYPLHYRTGLYYHVLFTELYDTRKNFKSQEYYDYSFCIYQRLYYYDIFILYKLVSADRASVFALNGILITLFIIGWRILYSYLLEQAIFKRSVLIIGAGWAGKTILHEIAKSSKSGLRVVGFIDDDQRKKGSLIDGIPVLGNRYTLNNVIHKHDIDLIIGAITHEKHADLIKALINCSWNGIEIVDMPAIYEQLTGKIPFKHINNMWMLHTVISKPKLYGRMVKPFIETFVALLLFILLIPAMVITAMLVKIDSKGRIFYTQERIGKDGKNLRL